MKKTKVIIPAMGLLLLSTAASITGTVAWFAVNTSVTVSGLSVKAKAEGGIVIAKYALASASAASDTHTAGYNDTLTDATYTTPVAANYANSVEYSLSAAQLYPTSTDDAETWYHGTSTEYDSHAATNQAALAGLQTDGQNFTGDGTSEAKAYALDGQYFLYNKFSLKATNDSSFSLWVDSITVTGEVESQALNKSLRVAVQVGTADPAFFAPLYLSTDETVLKWYNGAVSNATVTKGDNPDIQVANNTIVKAGIDMHVWVYYEGEDSNCKTSNTENISVDALSIAMSFTTINPAA